MSIGRYICVASFLVMALSAGASAQSSEPPPTPPPVLNDEQLLSKYVWSTLGADGIVHATLVSGYDQWRANPEDWGSRWDGYAKRWASEFAASAIGSTTKYAVAHWEHQDPSFVRCSCTGFGPRLQHALASPFIARRRNGRSAFSLATVAGLTAENVIPAATWYPAPRGTRDGLAHAAAGIGAKMAFDVFKEFVIPPRKKSGR
jgi:hypothetical protein